MTAGSLRTEVIARLDVGDFDGAQTIVSLATSSNEPPPELQLLRASRLIQQAQHNVYEEFQSWLDEIELCGLATLQPNNLVRLTRLAAGSGSRTDLADILSSSQLSSVHIKDILRCRATDSALHGEWDDALALWSEVCLYEPVAPDALSGSIVALLELRRHGHAASAIEGWSRLDPSAKGVLGAKRQFERSLHFRGENLATNKEAVALFPLDRKVVQDAFHDAIHFDDLDAADRYLALLTGNTATGQLAAQQTLDARMLEARGNFDGAESTLRKSLADHPRHAIQTRFALARLSTSHDKLRSVAERRAAADDIRKLADRFPHIDRFRTLYAEQLVALHDRSEALRVIGKIPTHLDHQLQVKALRGWAAHQRGEHRSARRAYLPVVRNRGIVSVHSPITNLEPVTTISDTTPDALLAFSVIRNERNRLPGWLAYYRNLGVSQFVMVDNESDDSSIEFLRGQPDVDIWTTTDTYLQSHAGMRWVNELVHQYTHRHKNWCVYADVDEFLVYPEMKSMSLTDLTEHLDRLGCEALRSFMLDVFDREHFFIPLNEEPPQLDGLGFINDYRMEGSSQPPFEQTYGGLRSELHPEFNATLTKTPLVRGDKVQFLASSHVTSYAMPSTTAAALVHLKYVDGFIERAGEEAERKMHARGGRQFRIYANAGQRYKQFLDRMKDDNRLTVFESAEQLVALGLINNLKRPVMNSLATA